MTRVVLSFLVTLSTVVCALCCAFVRARNVARAAELASLARRTEMLEAGIEQLDAESAFWRWEHGEDPDDVPVELELSE